MAVNAQTSLFKPVAVSENPRMWKGDIGLMNTSKTNVVFTIDSLVEFLKNLQVEVDSNLNEFKNLPKYAAFGRMEAAHAPAPVQATQAATETSSSPGTAAAEHTTPSASEPVNEASSQQPQTVPTQSKQQVDTASASTPQAPTDPDVFVPTRKVREPPGGGTLTIGNLFGGPDDEPDTRRRQVSGGRLDATFGANAAHNDSAQGFIPTRKVREPPGGKSQVGAIIFG